MGNPIEATTEVLKESSKTIRTAELTVERKTVCIVVFRSLRDAGRVPEVHYQATIDPELVSPSGQYIRMGTHKGDEIIGWQPIREIVVVEKLAEWDGDELPELPKQAGALIFDMERITEDVIDAHGTYLPLQANRWTEPV